MPKTLSWRRWRRARVLRRHPIPDHLWLGVTRCLPLLAGLTARQRSRLRVLTTLFLHEKTFTPVQGMVLDDRRRLVIAAQACLPILALDLDDYRGWVEIVVYPEAFRVAHETQDELGLVRREQRTLLGESWERGPVILSWADVAEDSFRLHHGQHVVIHEFAHKLDAGNGVANGMPPLHADMSRPRWTAVMQQAFDRLNERLAHHHAPPIDPYAATDPAEFFAVCSEYFFTAPRHLRAHLPAVYGELRRYYRQDPAQRLPARLEPLPCEAWPAASDSGLAPAGTP